MGLGTHGLLGSSLHGDTALSKPIDELEKTIGLLSTYAKFGTYNSALVDAGTSTIF